MSLVERAMTVCPHDFNALYDRQAVGALSKLLHALSEVKSMCVTYTL